MATSGSSDFALTGNEIIRAAARKIQAVRAGASMNTQAIQDWRQALNSMVKHWQADDLHVWTVSEGVLITKQDQFKYALSDASSSAHACFEDDFVQVEIAADAAAGALTIDVDDTTDIAAADTIAIELDDGSIQFSTVASKTSSSVTIADALTDACSEGAFAYSYTSKIARPIRIVSARSYDPRTGIETPLTPLSRQEYRDLPNKSQTGTVNQYFYDKQLTAGQLYLWQPLGTADRLVKFTWHRPIEDFDAGGDNPDLPQEWIQTLIFNLALVMAPEYDVPTEKFNQIAVMAEQYLDTMKGFDREEESVRFGVDMEG